MSHLDPVNSIIDAIVHQLCQLPEGQKYDLHLRIHAKNGLVFADHLEVTQVDDVRQTPVLEIDWTRP